MSAAICGAEVLFQSTLSMRRATETCCRAVTMLCISIHALHEESDSGIRRFRQVRNISIHALHEESDLITLTVVSED